MYLLLYNVTCLLGWATVLAQTVKHLAQAHSPGDLYQDVTPLLHITQSLACLEIVHAAAGLVRTPVFTAVQQVASRLYVVWGILWTVPGVAEGSIVVWSGNGAIVGLNLYTLLLSWGITEVIRYAFYAAKDLGSAPGLLTWLRYTTFIVLYPLGVASELAMVALAVPIIRQNDLLKYPMPNNFNMAFDYSVAVLLVALCYVPGFPPMYMYMFRQRKKVLGSASKAKQA